MAMIVQKENPPFRFANAATSCAADRTGGFGVATASATTATAAARARAAGGAMDSERVG